MRIIKYTTGFLLLLLITVEMAAQQKTTPRLWQFHSINTIGLLEGQAGSAFQAQTINGVQYKSWFAGAGIGLDSYKFRGIPLFLDIRKMFPFAANTFFLYGDIGMHANWLTEKQKSSNGYIAVSDLSNGLYTDAGTGVEISLDKKTRFVISAGYSYKALNGKQTDYTPITYDGPPAISSLRYNLSRLSLKAGLKF
jgi:hypothetical protein